MSDIVQSVYVMDWVAVAGCVTGCKKRRNDGATGATNTRCAASCWRNFGQVADGRYIAGTLPRTAMRESASVGPTWIAGAGRFAQLPMVMFRRTSGRMPGATQSVRRELFGQQRTDGHFNWCEPSTRRGHFQQLFLGHFARPRIGYWQRVRARGRDA